MTRWISTFTFVHLEIPTSFVGATTMVNVRYRSLFRSFTKNLCKMKQLENLKKLLQDSSVPDSAKDVIISFISANTGSTPPSFNLFSFTANSSSSSQSIKGVFYEKGFAIATNAYILIRLLWNYPKEHEGKIVDKNGNIIDASYPNYKVILPSYDKKNDCPDSGGLLRENIIYLNSSELPRLIEKVMLKQKSEEDKDIRHLITVDKVGFRPSDLKLLLSVLAEKKYGLTLYKVKDKLVSYGRNGEIVILSGFNLKVSDVSYPAPLHKVAI